MYGHRKAEEAKLITNMRPSKCIFITQTLDDETMAMDEKPAKQITHPNVMSLQRLYRRLRCPGPVELPPTVL